MEKYKFDCGCEFTVESPTIKEIDGLPSLHIDFSSINHNCPKTWEVFHSGMTKGVFQLENKLGQDWSKKIKPSNLDELSAVISVIRPGTLKSKLDGTSLTQHFADRKNGSESTEFIHESLRPILASTYGILVYQEQAMRIAVDLAGFNLQEADTLRKCVTGDTTFISKQRGFISINELLETGYENDDFLIMDENGVQRWKKIEKIWSTGKHDVVEIETINGLSVKATKYHQFLTNNGWKARCRLDDNDYLVCPSVISYDGKDEISENLAIIIAGLITEGYFVDYNCATFVNYDDEMMQTFEHAMLEEFDFKKTTTNKTVFRIHKEEKEKISKYLTYGKSESKFIPSVMMRMTLETTRKFLSFMLAAEGGISKNGQFEYSSKSEKCIKQVQLLLLRFGIRSNLIKTYNKKYQQSYYKLYINDVIEQKKLLEGLTILWPKSKIESLTNVINKKGPSSFTIDIIPNNIVMKMINQFPFIGNKESGSIYRKPISKNRFKRLALASNDRTWVNFSNGLHSYYSIKNKNNKTRQVETFDFTVAGGDTPYIIANGIVIHNSIGKKIPELMTQVEILFLEKSKQLKIVDDNTAKTIFSWIRESQKYSFNKSHGVGYSEIGYWCAYVKAHFPIHFYTSWLYYAKDKQFSQEEVELLIEDAFKAGISVLPPTIKYGNDVDLSHFFTKNGNIYFGVADIKKIGDSLAKKLSVAIGNGEQELGKKIGDWSWYEFLVFIGDEISSSAMNNLIAVGGVDYLDCGMSRNGKLFQYNVYNQLDTKEKQYIKYIGVSSLEDAILKILNDTLLKRTVNRRKKLGDLLHSLRDAPYSTKDTRYQIIKAEQELLGVPVSCSRTDECSVSGESMCVDIPFKKGKTTIAVEILSIREHIIKSGASKGKKMAFLKVKDSSGTSDDVVIFSEKYEEAAALITKGNTLLLGGVISNKNNKVSFVVNEVTQI